MWRIFLLAICLSCCMGCIPEITADSYPRQGGDVGRRCKVTFHYKSSPTFFGTIVREDREAPYRAIIKLDDGRYVTGDECQYSTYAVPNFGPTNNPCIPVA